jgi:hypothetical protein
MHEHLAARVGPVMTDARNLAADRPNRRPDRLRKLAVAGNDHLR